MYHRVYKLVLAVLLACGVVVSYAQEQMPLKDTTSHKFSDTRHGKLYHFPPEVMDDVVDIVYLTQDYDVWHVSETHGVHVYADSSLPDALLSLPHSVSEVPFAAPSRSHPSEGVPKYETKGLNSTFHAAYHTLHEAADFMSQLATAFPDNFRVTNLGLSAEGREILGAVVSNRTDDPDQDRQKLTVVIVGTQHAREWIATSTALYLMEALLVDRSLRLLLNLYDFHIIPIPNPDGYVYTWEHDRFWYKNRQVLGRGIQCVGLDMNRDWGYKWKPEAKGGAQLDVDDKYDELSEHADFKASSKKTKTVKKSKKTKPPIDPCSHWYPGNRPFESPEVNNLANYVQAIQTEVVSFIDLRSFGQMVSSPYSYSCKRLPKDAEDQLEAALGAAKAIKSVHGAQYTTGTLCETLYRAPGNVLDWMYARQGVKYSYSVHLRDTGTYAFLIPPEWILPVGEEISAMISYIASFIAKQRGLPL